MFGILLMSVLFFPGPAAQDEENTPGFVTSRYMRKVDSGRHCGI